MRSLSSVSSRKASMRSHTRLAMLDGWPSQIGVPITRMSAARMRARSLGQASPLPSLDCTPGLMLRSATRTIRPVQSWLAKASDTCFNRASVDDFSPARFRVQLSAMNFSGAGAMAGPSCPNAVGPVPFPIPSSGNFRAGLRVDDHGARFPTEEHMQAENMQDRPGRHDASGRPVVTTKEARQGVTGHNVRYVLIFGLIAVVVGFALGYLGVAGFWSH